VLVFEFDAVERLQCRTVDDYGSGFSFSDYYTDCRPENLLDVSEIIGSLCGNGGLR
jgi:hypothetical protein